MVFYYAEGNQNISSISFFGGLVVLRKIRLTETRLTNNSTFAIFSQFRYKLRVMSVLGHLSFW